jgi:prolyl-tRNA editing enzyme YbaK/EbsC (Cys-tRNA(Pro) deacylase)
MSASKKITAHLGKRKIKFEVVPHRKVYTAYDLAQTLGAKLDDIAKTLLVQVELPVLKKKEKRNYIVVLPASYYMDFKKLKKALKASKVSIAPEKAMAKLGIKPGALSPFGSLRKLGVVVDKALLKTKDLLVGAESFTESLRMKAKDLVAVEAPVVAQIGKKAGLKLQKKKKK